MKRTTFTDIDKKKGTIGSIVVDVYMGEEIGKRKIVKDIISKGVGGTRIYFEGGGYGSAKYFRIVG